MVIHDRIRRRGENSQDLVINDNDNKDACDIHIHDPDNLYISRNTGGLGTDNFGQFKQFVF